MSHAYGSLLACLHDPQKPDLQADSLRRYAIRAGLEIVAEYLEVAISGRKEGRPQLQDFG
jgi:hypothetical protein